MEGVIGSIRGVTVFMFFEMFINFYFVSGEFWDSKLQYCRLKFMELSRVSMFRSG